MKSLDGIKRGVLVAGLFLAILFGQTFHETIAEKAAVQDIVAELEKWNSSRDLNVQASLHEQIENRMKSVQDPADLIRALPLQFLDTFAANEAFQEWWDGSHRDGLLDWMATQENPPRYQVIRLLREMADDTVYAHRYIGMLPEGAWKERVLGTLAEDDVLDGRPQAAIELLDQMPKGDKRTALLQSAIFEWSQRDFKGAIDWLSRAPAPESRKDLIEPAALGCAITDPQAAVRWLLQIRVPDEWVDAAIHAVVGRWAEEHKPEDAAVWVEQLPEGKGREAALEGLIGAWKQADPRALANWISKLPKEASRAEATRILRSSKGRSTSPAMNQAGEKSPSL